MDSPFVGRRAPSNDSTEWAAQAPRSPVPSVLDRRSSPEALDLASTSLRLAPIAVRGTRLALMAVTVGDVVEPILAVVDAPGARAEAVALFDLDDFKSAQRHFTSRFVAGEGAPYEALIELSFKLGRVTELTDPDERRRRFSDLIASDYVSRDFRNLGRATLSGPQAYDDVADQYPGVSKIDHIAVEYHRLAPNASLFRRRELRWTDLGSELEWESLILFVMESGQLKLSEEYDIQDLDRAITRFEEVAA